MTDIALSKNSMMFVTQDGEGFSGVWAGEYKKYGEKKGEEFMGEKGMFSMLSWQFIYLFFPLHFLSVLGLDFVILWPNYKIHFNEI